MKLKFDVSNESPKRQQQIKESLETELAVPMVIKGGILMQEDQQYASDFTQLEIFQLGEIIGTQDEYEKQTKPDELIMRRQFANLLEEALRIVEEETHIRNTTIEFKKSNDKNTEIIIKPTDIRFLFNWFRKYGELCVTREAEIERLIQEEFEKDKAEKI